MNSEGTNNLCGSELSERLYFDSETVILLLLQANDTVTEITKKGCLKWFCTGQWSQAELNNSYDTYSIHEHS